MSAGRVEQARRALMLSDPQLYRYIEAHVAARELDRAGGDASGAETGHGAANRIWQAAARWEGVKRDVVANDDGITGARPA